MTATEGLEPSFPRLHFYEGLSGCCRFGVSAGVFDDGGLRVVKVSVNFTGRMEIGRESRFRGSKAKSYF